MPTLASSKLSSAVATLWKSWPRRVYCLLFVVVVVVCLFACLFVLFCFFVCFSFSKGWAKCAVLVCTCLAIYGSDVANCTVFGVSSRIFFC